MEDPDAASPQPATDDRDAASLHAAMEVPVTAALGPAGPLLRNLHSLIDPDWLPADDFRRLRDGLTVLCVALKDLSEAEDASFTAKWWMKIVRELCYDAEDHLDEVIFSGAGGAHQTAKGLPFAELIARVEDATERRKRFRWSPKTIKPDRGEPGVSHLTPRLSLQLPVPISVHGGRSIIGVEPTNRLLQLLALDDDDEKKLKVIPIFGVAGVGKATVARSLYDKYGGNFQCRAFVRVSRNPDLRRLLTSMLSQIKAPQPHGFPDVTDLIDSIKKHLQGKRYFIIMNDLWTASVWDIISRAFPPGDYCSRIITTTPIDDVAWACCSYYSEHIYEMSPLNDDESRKLFFGRVFGSEDSCPTDIKEVSYEIIRKCGGLPLAITIIASLLASDPNIVMEKWKHIQDSLASTSEGMRDVLYLIYNSLPPHLKTFLLYLSMYPEGYPIGKHDLVEQWVAEGFLGAVEGQDTEEIAESYFDELVSRGMMQAVDTNYDGEVLSCTVHHMVLDLIRNKSMQENFVITVDNFQSTLALPDKVRRLSVQFGGAKGARIPESIIWSQVRSLKFCGFFECVPSIADYGLLRVLILHIWADENKIFDLSGIGELFRLRYLKIECNMTIKLPAKIGGLQYLETLEIDARIPDVPSDIVHLENLLHLRLPSEANLPHGVGHMMSLRTLGYFDLGSNSEDNVMDIGKLTNIQDLHLTCSTVQPRYNLENNMKCLGSIFWKLSSLKCIALVPASGSSSVNTLQGDAGASSMSISCDGLSSVSPAPVLLERLELPRMCIFPSLPKWFGKLSKLCILKIAVRGLSREDIDILKGLAALTALSLYIQTAPAERIVIDDEEGFPLLRYFKFMCTAPCLSFVEGAMPNVRKLKLGFNANRMKRHSLVVAGFNYLTGLREISLKLGGAGADESDRRAAESALQAAVGLHPNRDLISRVQCVDVIFDGEGDTRQGQEQLTLGMHQDIEESKMEHPSKDVNEEIASGALVGQTDTPSCSAPAGDRSMASGVGGGGGGGGGDAAGEGEWLKVAELRAMVEAQDPLAKEERNLTLRRFLRARDHDVGKASAMFLKFLKWRREAVPGGAAMMPAELVQTELSHEKACMGGVDRTGRPVLIAFPARHYSANRDMAEHKRFVVYLLDSICARIPRGQEKFLCIVDLKGWGYSNCDVRAYIAAKEIMQNYYPERLGKALMIHVPYIFMKAWKMVYPFIDTNTREKFVFVDDTSLEETLKREMEESQIPEMYGGKLPLVPLRARLDTGK